MILPHVLDTHETSAHECQNQLSCFYESQIESHHDEPKGMISSHLLLKKQYRRVRPYDKMQSSTSGRDFRPLRRYHGLVSSCFSS